MLKRIAFGILLILVSVGMLTTAFNIQPVKASPATIYIRANGSVEGTTYLQTTDNVTYVFTANINESIVVERNNIIIDGNGFTLQGNESGFPYLGKSGFYWAGIDNVTIRNTSIKDFTYGIKISDSLYNNIVMNNITENFQGIRFFCSNSNIIGNVIKASRDIGLFFVGSTGGPNYNKVSNNVIMFNKMAFNGSTWYSEISYNFVSNNTGYSIYLEERSRYNKIIGNTVQNNGLGIGLNENSTQNIVYHNNIINNTEQGNDGLNTWDNGYPSGGNYWSDYAGQDLHSGLNQNQLGSDGIGDMPHSADRYPLMAPFKSFNAGTWHNKAYYVDIVSNSTTTNFNFNPLNNPPTLNFTAEGQDGTAGFVRIAIPKDIMWCDNPSEWVIKVGDVLTPAINITETTDYAYLYFTYTHSTKTVQIQSTHAVPEFQPTFIVPLLITITLLLAVSCKRKRTH